MFLDQITRLIRMFYSAESLRLGFTRYDEGLVLSTEICRRRRRGKMRLDCQLACGEMSITIARNKCGSTATDVVYLA